MSFLDTFTEIKAHLYSREVINTDNFVFKLHYVVTFTVLIIFSVVLSLSQYVGDPIDCLVQDSWMGDTFDKFCWVEGTYTKKPMATLCKGIPSQDECLASFGLEKNSKHRDDLSNARCFHDNNDSSPANFCWHHQFYQWVALVLVLQAGAFYFPKYLWQIWEEGRIKSLVEGLDKSVLVRGLQSKEALNKGELNDKIKTLINHWRESANGSNIWAAKFIFCEILNVVNVICQFYFTNFFLQGEFNTIAMEGIYLDEHNSVLPILAECRIEKYGSGGGKEIVHGLCVLPLNMVNQKFYVFFWFWLSVLQIVSVAQLTYRFIVVFSQEARDFVLRYVYGIKEFNRNIVTRSSHGDWFLLTSLLDNMNGIVNSVFLIELGKLKEYSVFDD